MRGQPARGVSRLFARARELPLGDGLAAVVVLAAFFAMLAPMLADFGTYGFHDWDVHTAYRYVTVQSIKEYGQAPWWQAFLCGGVPAFGNVEGATNFVSPYLPLYLVADERTAIRLEVVGNGLVGLAGAYALAARYTKSAALRALFALLFVVNGRWAMQAAVGHTWHLQYAWTPWVFWFFTRAIEEGPLRRALWAGVVLAGMCFWGGIYPLPQTALLLGVFAVLAAIFRRSLEPVAAYALTGAVALGLAAPKLLAVADHMQKLPRFIDSTEVIGLSELVVMLTHRDQAYGHFPVRVPAYNWHEWGLYIGAAGLICLAVGAVFGRGAREQPLKICGLLCLLLGFGAFHPFAPWKLLHELPVFSSLHVPSRFHYPMVFFLGLTFVAVAGRALDPWLKRRPRLDAWLLAPVVLVAIDLAEVNQIPFTQAFWMEAPAEIPRAARFEHRTHAPVDYVRPDWAGPMLLSMKANTGVLRCYGVDTALVPGAIAADTPGYRGAAYVADGPGRAEVVDWSPNRAVVRVEGARPGSLLVYNMNYDPSWRAAGAPAIDHRGAVATRLEQGSATVTFSYFPRSFAVSLPLFAATLGALLLRPGALGRLRRRLNGLSRRRAVNAESAPP